MTRSLATGEGERKGERVITQVGLITILISMISIIKNHKNNILLLLSLELFFIGIAILYIDTGIYLDDLTGFITAIFILCLSATESAIGLTILILHKKNI